jgi:hypothetical protein
MHYVQAISVVALEVLLLLLLRPVDSVIHSENVLGVDVVLDVLHEVDSHLGKSLLHESLSDFSNAVVVRDAASVS